MPNEPIILRGITTPGAFASTVLTGVKPPAADVLPLGGFTVQTTFWTVSPSYVPMMIVIMELLGATSFPAVARSVTTKTAADGSFVIPSPPGAWGKKVQAVSLLISDWGGNPVYRTEPMAVDARVSDEPQDIWLYTPEPHEPNLKNTLCTVGQASKLFQALKLPGFVVVTSGPGGLQLTNDKLPDGAFWPADVEIEFQIAFPADTSPILPDLLDVELVKSWVSAAWFLPNGTAASVEGLLAHGVSDLATPFNNAVVGLLDAELKAAGAAVSLGQKEIDQFLASITTTLTQVTYADTEFIVGIGPSVEPLITVMPRIGYPRGVNVSFGSA